MNFSICIFKGFFGYFLAIFKGILLMAASTYKFYNMTLLMMIFSSLLSEAYSEPSQISKMEVFCENSTGFKMSNIFAKVSILDVCLVFQSPHEYFVNTCDPFV